MDVALTLSLVSAVHRAEANGPHALVLDLARGLIARGHRATIYAAAGSEIDDVPVVEIAVDPAAAAAALRPGASERPPNEALRRGFWELFAALRRGGHDVVSQHAFDAEAFEFSRDMPVLHTLHLPPIVPAVVEAARACTCALAAVSAFAWEQWSQCGVETQHLLRNGVPDLGLEARTPEPLALVAGRISPEKGTADAIDAARRAGLPVAVVGDAYDNDYYHAEVEPRLLPGELRGPLPRRELAALMNASAALLMPVAWDEPFGLVAAEAQMAGCPVVAYRRGALPELIEDGVTGRLVRPGDTDELARALVGWRSFDRGLIRLQAQRRFSLDVMVDRYAAALSTIA